MSKRAGKQAITFWVTDPWKDEFARVVEFTPEGNMSRWLTMRIKELLIEHNVLDKHGNVKADE